MEMATGHPSFDVVNVGMHVQKRLIESAKWMEDLRPFIADKILTAIRTSTWPISASRRWRSRPAPDGKINVLPN